MASIFHSKLPAAVLPPSQLLSLPQSPFAFAPLPSVDVAAHVGTEASVVRYDVALEASFVPVASFAPLISFAFPVAASLVLPVVAVVAAAIAAGNSVGLQLAAAAAAAAVVGTGDAVVGSADTGGVAVGSVADKHSVDDVDIAFDWFVDLHKPVGLVLAVGPAGVEAGVVAVVAAAAAAAAVAEVAAAEVVVAVAVAVAAVVAAGASAFSSALYFLYPSFEQQVRRLG